MENRSQELTVISQLENLQKIIIKIFFFLFPVFFLPFFINKYSIPKIILTASVAILIMFINLIKIIITRKIQWKNSYLELSIILFLITQILSLIISTPNKFQSLFVGPESLVFLLSLAIISLNAIKLQISIFSSLMFSSILLSIVIIFSFLNIYKYIPIPKILEFIKNPYFTPLGSYLEALILIGFITFAVLIKIFSFRKEENIKNKTVLSIVIIPFLIALILGIYNIFNPVEVNGQKFRLILPPVRISWFAAVEILKNPLTAFFGIGFNNFASIFTRVKTPDYNLSDLWQIGSFDLSASALLHIFTTSGFIGFLAFIYLLLNLYKNSLEKEDNTSIILFILFLIILIGFPLSLSIWFILFSLIIEIDKPKKEYSLNIGQIPLIYLSYISLYTILLLIFTFALVRYTKAEYYYFLANQAIEKNEANQAFEYHKKAIQEFPYKEEFRKNFSMLNILIAQNFVTQIQERSQQKNTDEQEINTLRQNLSQTIQLAINEAKAVVALNPQKADNWAFLANIYRNILFLAQGSDAWAISSYRRAIQLDPLNPVYNLNLAGILYALENYNEAENIVETAIAAKPDWPNAYYNMAWIAYKKGEYQKAVQMMQTTLNLLDPKKDKQDYEKAKKELEEFKKNLPKEELQESTSEAQIQNSQKELNIPTPPQNQTQEKIQLPKEASPEAQ